jgi:hypothetical protein
MRRGGRWRGGWRRRRIECGWDGMRDVYDAEMMLGRGERSEEWIIRVLGVIWEWGLCLMRFDQSLSGFSEWDEMSRGDSCIYGIAESWYFEYSTRVPRVSESCEKLYVLHIHVRITGGLGAFHTSCVIWCDGAARV